MRAWRVVLAVVCLLLAGCGGDDEEPAGGDGKPVTLRLGVLPIGDVAPLYLGMERGPSSGSD